jgi:hypothetical protein
VTEYKDQPSDKALRESGFGKTGKIFKNRIFVSLEIN